MPPGDAAPVPPGCEWRLSGAVSNLRYATRAEVGAMQAAGQAPLGTPSRTRAALLPVKKSARWWAMTQDERAAVLSGGGHVTIGLRCLPAVARRLHHCRDLCAGEPFDFLTWFEFAPGDEAAFDSMLAALRATPEWTFVEREVDVRLERDG